MEKFMHICEVCGKEKLLTSDEAFQEGWDYPPNFGQFGIIGPRTCPDCSINETLWWELSVKKTPMEKLSERHTRTLLRFLKEKEEILKNLS